MVCPSSQTFVDLGAKRGRFEVSIKDGTLLGRNAVQSHCLSKAKTMQAKLRDTLNEPICSSSIALTTDMWTDNFRKLSYLDAVAAPRVVKGGQLTTLSKCLTTLLTTLLDVQLR